MYATQTTSSQLCPCGSGLTNRSCCAMTEVNLLSKQQEEASYPHYKKARAAFEQGDMASAEQVCVNILEQLQAHVGALRLLLGIKTKAGQKPAEEALLKRLVKLEPNDGELACELAMLFYQQRNNPNAEHHARNGVRLNPANPQAHNLMGMIMTDQGRSLSGEYHYRRAMELHRPLGKLHANLALNLRNQGKIDESEEQYRKAVELEPNNVASLMGWVKLEEARQNFDKAWELLRQAEAMEPENSEVRITRATLYSRAKEFDKAIIELDSMLERDGAATLGPGYYLERGKILDKLGRYDDAFEAYDKANLLIRDSGRGDYDAEHPARLANHLKGFFKRHRMTILPRAAVKEDSPQPLFIIGFPRSGTTMTEQILTAHPSICAADELAFVGDLVRFGPKLLNSPLDYPESFSELWMGDNQEALEDLRDWYLKRTQQLGVIEEGASWFTDKMPLNETHLGLIHLVFPESPVVHLHRHPLDVVLSTFFIDLTHGHNCSYQLKTAAQHYLLTMDLVEHYTSELDELRYMKVRYEDLVTDQEANVKQLLEFIGVPWDERCLNFHENKRYARTASYAQVTEKLYTTSRYRYKNYRRHLDEIIPMLEPVIERLGYTIED